MKRTEIYEVKALTTESEIKDALKGQTILTLGKLLSRKNDLMKSYENQGFTVFNKSETTFVAVKTTEEKEDKK